MILRTFRALMFMVVVLVITPSCNHNKIACPTYADSFPDAKKAKKSDKPEAPKALPKATKSNVSHSMGPGH